MSQSACVVLFGLPRAMHVTAPTIERHIQIPMRTAGFKINTIAHFNIPAMVHSPRSGEYQIPMKFDGLADLPFDHVWLEKQDDQQVSALWDMSKQNVNIYNDPEFLMQKNALHQLKSISKSWEMVKMLGLDSSNVYIFARPDLVYHDSLLESDIDKLVSGDVDIIFPQWHKWGGYNDRFCLCNRRIAESYACRIRDVEAFIKKRGFFHTEMLLAFVIDKSGGKIGFTEMRASRIRATGEIKEEDFSLAR